MSFTELFTVTPTGAQHYSVPHVEQNLAQVVFGGQIMATALAAARHEIGNDRCLASLTADFIHPISLKIPPQIRVDKVVGDKSSSHCKIEVLTDRKVALRASLHFQRTLRADDSATEIVPDVPSPDQLMNLADCAKHYAGRFDKNSTQLLCNLAHYELRPAAPENFFFGPVSNGICRYWLKARNPLPEEPRWHEMALVYLSDVWIHSALVMQRESERMSRNYISAAQSHSLRIHSDFRADHWLLFDTHSPALSGETGAVHARIYNLEGTQVATASQEVLYRLI